MVQASLFFIGLGIAFAYAINAMWLHAFNTVIADVFYLSFTFMMAKLIELENLEDLEDDESTIE